MPVTPSWSLGVGEWDFRRTDHQGYLKYKSNLKNARVLPEKFIASMVCENVFKSPLDTSKEIVLISLREYKFNDQNCKREGFCPDEDPRGDGQEEGIVYDIIKQRKHADGGFGADDHSIRQAEVIQKSIANF
jgi:hypothetical protein